MFGKRPDGRKVRTADPLQLIMGSLMRERSDSMNMYEDTINCEPWDKYIKEKEEQGLKINYMHIFIAGIVRIIALNPRLNRFVMNGKIYTRDKIWVSFVVHPELSIDCPETTIKICFEGTESLLEIAEKIDAAIKKETTQRTGATGTDKLAGFFTAMPSFIMNGLVGLLMWMDRHNIMPKFVIDLSPFHTSFFITNLKSLGINHIYHHTTNFGTNGLFFAIGKEKQVPVVEKGEIVIQKQMGFGLVSDERFCDGLYFALALRSFRKLMKNPAVLENPLDKKVEDMR